EIAQALGSSLGVAEAMALIQDKVNRLVPFTTCALFLGDDEQGYVCRYAHGQDLVALLPCPLMFERRLIGGLVIYHTVAGCFTDEHRRVLGRVSEQAAAVIYNSTRFEQTEHESHTDPLTALPNRRSLDRQFEAGLARAERSKSSVSVVVLDLDRLKEINDTYGHEAGDRVLRAVGSTLRTTVRQHDLCARFAGDEFIVVLWDCSPEHEARRVLELQTAVGAAPFEPRPGVRVSLSISAGAARFPHDGASFDELMAAADERMYHDKAGRRSRSSSRATVKRSEPA